MGKTYVGDVGTAIRLDTKQAIATATVKRIKYTKPDGTTGYWDAAVVASTKLQYITQSGDLDQAYTWLFQAYVVMPDWSGLGETASLVIYAHFQ